MQILFGVIFFLIVAGLRIVNQFERGVVLTLGKYTGTRGPGLTWVFIGIQGVHKVDMRIRTIDIARQEVITKDNVPAGINAVVYFQVSSAENATLNIQDYTLAVSQYAQAVLRDIVGNVDLDTLLSEREETAQEIQKIVEKAITEWGIKIFEIKIQDIELPQDMKRIMAKQAESERERRALIIRADGEREASVKLSEAAKILAETHGGIAMRTLQTIEKTKSNTFIIPAEFLDIVRNITAKH